MRAAYSVRQAISDEENYNEHQEYKKIMSMVGMYIVGTKTVSRGKPLYYNENFWTSNLSQATFISSFMTAQKIRNESYDNASIGVIAIEGDVHWI